MTATRHVAVRMDMPVADGEWLDDNLRRMPADVRYRVLDQLWLRTILIEQRRRTRLAERRAFARRADRMLELLDPQEPS